MLKKLKFKTMLILGNSIILTLLIIMSIIIYNSVSYLITASHWVEHTYKVIGNASSLSRSMVDMETGQRGFMLTGDETFLEPYNTGQAVFSKTISTCIELVSDNPAQVKRFKNAEHLKDNWIKDAGQYEIDLKK